MKHTQLLIRFRYIHAWFYSRVTAFFLGTSSRLIRPVTGCSDENWSRFFSHQSELHLGLEIDFGQGLNFDQQIVNKREALALRKTNPIAETTRLKDRENIFEIKGAKHAHMQGEPWAWKTLKRRRGSFQVAFKMNTSKQEQTDSIFLRDFLHSRRTLPMADVYCAYPLIRHLFEWFWLFWLMNRLF